MEKSNSVFIGTSLDGYIADKSGGIAFLDSIPIPKDLDMGYLEFTSQIDALVMGRTTFETVLGFGIDWPYDKPVFVLSNTLKQVPTNLEDKVFLVRGSLDDVLSQIHSKGYYHLYIDGGVTIQNFLKEDLIDQMIITTIPVLLGEGYPLFGNLPETLNFECIKSLIYVDKIVQNHYKRVR